MNIKVFICLILQLFLAKASFGQEQVNSGVFQSIRIDTPVSEYPDLIKVDTISERLKKLKIAISFMPFRISHVNLTSNTIYDGHIPVKSIAVLCDSLSKITVIYLLLEPSEDMLPALTRRYGKHSRYAGFGDSAAFLWEDKDFTLTYITVNGRTMLIYKKNEEPLKWQEPRLPDNPN